jgi:hypothetical protein
MTTEMKQGTGIPQFCTFTFDFYLNKLPYLKKQTQFYPFLSPKTAFCPKTKPIQSQNKPKFILQSLGDGGQTQFFGLVNRAGKMLWVVFWILSFGDSDLVRI